jgi:toxin YoeB
MKVAWTEDAWQEYLQWQKEDQKTLSAVNDLIKHIKRDPFKGLGKPSGNGGDQQVEIAQCRYHY